MGSSKPLASLSSGLLARKGQARPAMRPQGFAVFPGSVQSAEDLGWNDMGEDVPPANAAPAVAAPLPQVLHQRAALAGEIAAPIVVSATPLSPTPLSQAPAPAAPAAQSGRLAAKPALSKAKLAAAQAAILPLTGKAKAAFTLRLDAERHLRLRLASALQNRSSQQLVTEALDMFLQALPDVEELAQRQEQSTQADLKHEG